MYNTVLGAKPLQPDGTAFYYSDYNFKGQKGYSNHRWPCCSGTLPQVAADYRINTYFHDANDLYVNLYIPSSVRWRRGSSQIEILQTGTYPFGSKVRFDVKPAQADEFGLHLRIPAWTEQASISVNGKREVVQLKPGSFAVVRRQWKAGDHVELELPMTTRLEAVDAQHPGTVALLYGPLVLFAATSEAPVVTRKQLLAASRAGAQRWQVDTKGGPMTMLPFIAIGHETYSTYLRVA